MEAERLEFRLVSPSAEATEALGEALGKALPPDTVLALDGDLGAGKTTLVRGLARGLGLGEGVASPTYVLMQAHEGGRLPLYHFDAWMEGREKALFLDGGDHWLRAGGIAVVEWAARVREYLPVDRLEVELGHRTPEERTLRLSAPAGGDLQRALEGILEALGDTLRGPESGNPPENPPENPRVG